MPQPIARPLPPAALRVLAVTADAWRLRMCTPLPAARACVQAAHNRPGDRRQQPNTPDHPDAAMGWR